MKIRILGAIFVFLILAALFVLTGGDNSTPNIQGQPQPTSSGDAGFKGLQIN